jgi:hypothetical protein
VPDYDNSHHMASCGTVGDISCFLLDLVEDSTLCLEVAKQKLD